METTIKLTKETKQRILGLDLAEKGKTFNMIVNDLVTSYEKTTKQYKKDYSEWKKKNKEWVKQNEKYKEDYTKFQQRKEIFDKLLRWAKSKGFKP